MSIVATIACLAFICYLFRTDVRRPNSPSAALWVPLAWMFLAGSRWVSAWLNLGAPIDSVDDYSEGSPVDRAVFLCLIIAGVLILLRRRIDWGDFVAHNKWLVLYLAFCLVSIAWTDQPYVLLKRWIKDLGNPIMALVILTDRRPYEALGAVLRRLAFLLIPLSLLFIRYYPHLGRSYHADGSPMYTGVGHQKNDLGLMCLISGIYLAWDFLRRRTEQHGWTREAPITALLLAAMVAWDLRMSNSQTSLACLLAAVMILVLGRFPFIAARPARILVVLALAGTLYWVLEETVDIGDVILAMLGRNPTFTNRTDLWETLRGLEVNRFIGAGFMSFWSGERMEIVWRIHGAGVNQAHNGYLEQYLNLGYVGLAFIGVIILTALVGIARVLNQDRLSGLLRLCFLVAAVLYNFTEASFYGMNNMWLLLLLGYITPPRSLAMATSEVREPLGVAHDAHARAH